ncbi:MAG TPA: tRNA (adenosine(37)-N6)-threonylcarbamoyltransferase complex dimerization subunit type 1 TsaB [Acidimicrobiales bacterium]|nr:tRNA (adenosine(37)-N6)-threonylcarbamoyltransferase complex dimerization subunit type 1 TsaB [Acidimicrobiales bacterium]
MTLLAIETATVEVGVALAGPGGLLAAATARPGRRHAETLHVAIRHVLELAGIAPDALEAIAVDVGPGLFTGLRVGVAAANAMAWALGVPVVACTSTDVLLHALRHDGREVVAVVDMRRGEVAWSSRLGGPIELDTPGALAGSLARRDAATLLVGDGARRHAAQLLAGGGGRLQVAGDELGAPPVVSLADLAVLRLEAGDAADPLAVRPVYLRPVDARINWSTRHGAAAPRAGDPAHSAAAGE